MTLLFLKTQIGRKLQGIKPPKMQENDVYACINLCGLNLNLDSLQRRPHNSPPLQEQHRLANKNNDGSE